MRFDARLTKIEKRIYQGKDLYLKDFLKQVPNGNALLQVFIKPLPQRGPVNVIEILDALPEELRQAVIQRITELRAINREKEGS